jgi:hypothetical protein
MTSQDRPKGSRPPPGTPQATRPAETEEPAVSDEVKESPPNPVEAPKAAQQFRRTFILLCLAAGGGSVLLYGVSPATRGLAQGLFFIFAALFASALLLALWAGYKTKPPT